MTASASWRGATPPGCGSIPATAAILLRDSRPSLQRLRRCRHAGEAIVSDESGLAVFELMRRLRSGLQALLCAFDLLELDDEEVQGALLPHPMHGVQSASR